MGSVEAQVGPDKGIRKSMLEVGTPAVERIM